MSKTDVVSPKNIANSHVIALTNLDIIMKNMQCFIGDDKSAPVNMLSATLSLMKLSEAMSNMPTEKKRDMLVSAMKKFISDNGGDVGVEQKKVGDIQVE